jgi:predicted methyltransferase
MSKRLATICVLLALSTGALAGQRAASSAELKQAQHDVPLLTEVLELKPGMTVADVGAGFGQMTIVLSSWIGPKGRVYATDLGAPQLTALREAVTREHLENVVVLDGAERSTNLPGACCDAIFLRDVYHHVTQPEAFDRSLVASLKPGGRLAVIDFPPTSGSKLPDGVPENRGGHGVPPGVVVSELSGQGLTHVKTIDVWPPDSNPSRFFLVLFRKP